MLFVTQLPQLILLSRVVPYTAATVRYLTNRYGNYKIKPGNYAEVFATEGIAREGCKSFYVHIFDGKEKLTKKVDGKKWGIKVSTDSVYVYNGGNTLKKEI